MNELPTSLTKFILHFMKKQPVAFIVFFSAPLLFVLEANVVPYALKQIIDQISNFHGNKQDILTEISCALWLGGLAWLGSMILLRLIHLWEAYVIPQFEADIRLSVVKYIISHSYQYFSSQLSGSIANKVKELPRTIESIREILCWNCLSTISVVFVSLILMTFINYTFSIILLIWLFFHFLITMSCIRFINKNSDENAEDKGTLSGIVVDIISNIISVKMFSNQFYELSYIGKEQQKEAISNKKLINSMNLFQVFTYIPILLMIGCVIYFLIISWQKESITTGDFVFIFSMVFFISQQMWHLSNALANLFRDIGTAQQALTLISCPRNVIDDPFAKPIEVKKGKICFKNVSFNYGKNSSLLQNINLEINPGDKIGLVGFSGSGKSTFVNLILRFFDVEEGIITIDDQDIKKVTQNSLRENIMMIPQDTNLFHRTLMENLSYGQNNIKEEQVIEAAKKAHCHDFIMQLDDQYSTIVGERGMQLSGGQRQRICIARAMLQNKPILILDEATSSLDSLTEEYIQEGLSELMQGRTTLIIAHRLSTLSKMDRILVFNNGKIVEDGTHVELLNRKGDYARLWEMQVDGLLPNKAKIDEPESLYYVNDDNILRETHYEVAN